VALLLRNKGIKRIRPLAGGLEGWRKLGFPLVTGKAETETEPQA